MRCRLIVPVLVALFAVLPSATQAAATADHYAHDQSEARHAQSGQLLYRESHWLWWRGTQLMQRRVQYRCPSGDVFAEKLVDYRNHALAPDFHLRDARNGYEEGLRSESDRRTVFVRRSRAESMQEAVLPSPAANTALVADAGFDAFLQQHWSDLRSGKALHFAFLVPSVLKPMAFKVRTADPTDASLITARLSLGAWWGFLAPHIDAQYRARDGRLLRYDGLSNLRDAEGDNYPVQIRFQDLPVSVDAKAYNEAGQRTLVSQCPGDMRALGAN